MHFKFILSSLGLVVAFCCICSVVRHSWDLVIPRYPSGSGEILDSRIGIIDDVHYAVDAQGERARQTGDQQHEMMVEWNKLPDYET
jgi:hypothetical protein